MTTIKDLLLEAYNDNLEVLIRPVPYLKSVRVTLRRVDHGEVLAKSEHEFLVSELEHSLVGDNYVRAALTNRIQDVIDLLTPKTPEA